MSDIELKIGDWIVARGSWRYEVGCITRITNQYIWRTGTGAYDRREDKARLVFCGDKEIAQKLVKQLESSGALYDQEKRAASERHKERTQKLIEAATIPASQRGT